MCMEETGRALCRKQAEVAARRRLIAKEERYWEGRVGQQGPTGQLTIAKVNSHRCSLT